jgi:hypothetical protein
MRSYGHTGSLQCEQCNVAELITEIATEKSEVVLRSAAALMQVCRAVITGEGPTVAGRIHFSRTIDSGDVSLCTRILILAGHHGDPVSRAEADVLFDINAAGSDRDDAGRFDDLLAKAVIHHVMSACGRNVPRREVALACETRLETWTSAIRINTDVKSWLETRLRDVRPSSAAVCTITEVISGTGGCDYCREVPIGAFFDLAA